VNAEPTLADDEARLADIAAELDAALRAHVPRWLTRRALALAPAIDRAVVDDAVTATMSELAPRLTRVLTADVDAGAGSPLATIRGAIGRLSAVLVEMGAQPVQRDEFDVRAFPDDVFALGPASFAEIDEALQEPGLLWGAARAHVHLRRRREGAG
jgi:hypothetical protein